MMKILKTRCTGYSEVITTGAGSFKPQDKAALTDIGTVLIFFGSFLMVIRCQQSVLPRICTYVHILNQSIDSREIQ